jgi:hypothetical protein
VNLIFIPATNSSGSSPPSPTSIDWKLGVLDLLVDESDCLSVYSSLSPESKNVLNSNLPQFFIRELERGGDSGKIQKESLQLLSCWQLCMSLFHFILFYFLAKLICNVLKVDFNTGRNSLPKVLFV